MIIDLNYQIPFTQYLRPDGRQRQIHWSCKTNEQEIKARALVEAGARFDTEVLQTGEVSLTCEMLGNDGEPHTIGHELAMKNDESVIEAVAKLVERAHETFINGGIGM